MQPPKAKDWTDLDIMGSGQFSRYNFTDIKSPYTGFDGFGVVKLSLWPFEDSESNSERLRFGPYLEAIPVVTSEDEFWWQRNVQYGIGLQYYPVRYDNNTWKEYASGVRFYALGAWRDFYDEPGGADPETSDFVTGFDYYYDNILESNDSYALLLYSNAGYRHTNFSLPDYDAFTWIGNVKLGPKFELKNAGAVAPIMVPYVVADWSWVPKHDARWWENYLRLGAGLRVYPISGLSDGKDTLDFLAERFFVFGEVLENIAWLGDAAPGSVHETDYRLGFGFSTRGFFGRFGADQ